METTNPLAKLKDAFGVGSERERRKTVSVVQSMTPKPSPEIPIQKPAPNVAPIPPPTNSSR